jgi:hypothetical protein
MACCCAAASSFAGLQILLSIFAGWLCARLRLFDPEVMSRNVNAFAMKGGVAVAVAAAGALLAAC